MNQKVSVRVTPESALEVLSHSEVTRMITEKNADVLETFRRCALAVLNTGAATDDTEEILITHTDFEVHVIAQERGIKLDVINAPENAFVDGQMIKGIQEHLFSVLRDIVYINNELHENRDINLNESAGITNAVFHIMRNSGVLKGNASAKLIVCWGGHSINETEYDYTKEVGYQMGLRGLDICTGCGPGAMKGPMKGATFGHAKQRIHGRYIGISEPGIIAAESPNPIVNKLIIMPDIEKRLEAFVRTGHGIVVFPGGVGTAEEILYILGILLHPENKDVPYPLIFTGPKTSEAYFQRIHEFIGLALGQTAQEKYEIIIDNPPLVAQKMKAHMEKIQMYRRQTQDAYYFNWVLTIPDDLQKPFVPDHEKMAQLSLHKNQLPHELASNLRKAFSGIVDGNVKANGIKAVKENGPYLISGDSEITDPLSELLKSFVEQKRMKIPTKEYIPCYKVIN